MESLDLLEGALQGFAGTLLLVSHDRAFLDNVVTQVLVAEGGGRWQEYAGGYSDALAQGAKPAKLGAPTRREAAAAAAAAARSEATSATISAVRPKPRRMSFKETRELEQLPDRLAALEAEQAALAGGMADPDYHRAGAERMRVDSERAAEIERLLDEGLQRWEELEALARATRG
jgi:ATP-binding cassette subfamily F protein uup